MDFYCKETVFCIEGHGRRYKEYDIAPYLISRHTTGELYRSCIAAHGRCIGKMYINHPDSNRVVSRLYDKQQVGWMFIRRDRGSITGAKIETWVEVFTTPPKKCIVFKGGEHPKFKR